MKSGDFPTASAFTNTAAAALSYFSIFEARKSGVENLVCIQARFFGYKLFFKTSFERKTKENLQVFFLLLFPARKREEMVVIAMKTKLEAYNVR